MKKIIIIFIFSVVSLYAIPYTLHAQVRVDFVLDWSTDTYIPLNYPGKALAINNSLIKVNAIPIAKSAANIESLQYQWYLDDAFVPTASGKGKTTFYFRARKSEGSTHEVRLKILDANGNQLTQKNLLIKIAAPEIGLAYGEVTDEQIENNREISEEAQAPIVNFDKIESELKYTLINPAETLPLYCYAQSSHPQQNVYFSAMPYFFNVKNINGLDFSWQFNNQPIKSANSKKQNLLRLTIEKYEEEFQRPLLVSISNKIKPLEKKSADLNILFTFAD